MRTLWLTVPAITLVAMAAYADDAIPPQTLAAIKSGTVFVKVKVKFNSEDRSGSGSGFVIKTEGDSAYIVTNHHVVDPAIFGLLDRRPRATSSARSGVGSDATSPDSDPRLITRHFKTCTVTVVFQSGTPREKSARGEVLAADFARDLAVLKVTGVRDLPAALEINREPKLVETMPVYTLGFPFGESLATGKNSPAITVGRGSISSLRMDDNGELALVQIDGSLNPGNSGGPVVDAQGRLVGVAEATIRGASGIGMAIPAVALTRMLQGRLGKVHLYASQDGEGIVTIHVEAGLIDPLNKIKSVVLYYLAAKQVQDKLKPSDPLEPLRGCRKLPLKIEEQLATGELQLKKGVTEVALLYQGVWVNGGQRPGLSESVVETIGAKPAQTARLPAAPSGPAQSSTKVRQGAVTDGRTEVLGFHFDPQGEDVAPGGAVLVGFEVGIGKFVNKDVVHAILPIYRNSRGEEIRGAKHGTEWSRPLVVRAKDGYAVGALTGQPGLGLDGFSLTFMKLANGGLNANDAYESDWVGLSDARPKVRLGDGRPVIGILFKENKRKNLSGVGLILTGAPVEPGTQETQTPPAASRPPSRPAEVAPSVPHSGPSSSAASQAATEYSPRNGRFTVMMPAGNKKAELTKVLHFGGAKKPSAGASVASRPRPHPGPHGGTHDGGVNVPVEGMSVQDGNVTYTAASVGIPAVVMREVPPDQRFTIVRDAIAAQVHGEVVEERDIKQASVAGKEYYLEGSSQVTRMRIYLIGGWVLYALVEGKTKEEVKSKEADKFYASFQLTDPKK